MKKFISLVLLLCAVVFVFAACSKPGVPSRTQSDVKVVTPQDGQKDAKDNLIGEDRAKEIALEKAGLNEDEVFFERVELDFDDGVWEYEVEFRQDRVEYNADIKADDGTILNWEKDLDD